MKYFKVSCEYYLKAKSQEEAEHLVQDDICDPSCFMESHIIIDEVNKKIAEKEGIYNE